MSRFLYGHTQAVSAFVSRIVWGAPRGFGACQTIGVLDAKGRLVGGMVYHNWHPEAQVIEMSGASTTPKWLTRAVLHEIFAYPFERLGCQLAVMRVSERDTRLHRTLTRLGFDAHPIPRLRGRDEGEIVFTLTDDEWRRRQEKGKDHGKKLAQPAAAA